MELHKPAARMPRDEIRHGSKRSRVCFVAMAQTLKEAQAEAERAKAEAEKRKAEAEKTKAEAEKIRAQHEKVTAQVERHEIKQTTQEVKRASTEIAVSADRTTVLAADRTIYAAERTYAAWVRTGLAALASGVGSKAILTGILPALGVKLAGSVLIVFSAFCFLAAVWREMFPAVPPPLPDARRIPSLFLYVVNFALAVVSAIALFSIWI